MNLPTNLFHNYIPPDIYLCQPDRTIINTLRAYNPSGNFRFNSYSELSFTVARTYIDLITGQILVDPCYDLVDSLRTIFIRGMGYFIIQDVKENIQDSDTKDVTCFSLEYAAGSKYLNSFVINAGTEDSVEYIYHMQENGINYSIDNPYKTAPLTFDEYERYYIKEYSDANSYTYEMVQIVNAATFRDYDEQLYVKAFPNVRFYNPNNTALSLSHLILAHLPEWNVGYVDPDLWFQERTFTVDRESVYDFIQGECAEAFSYVAVWDSLNMTVSFYATTEDGLTTENSVDTLWDTDIYISKQNLASQIDISYSTDDIKTRLKVSGNDNLDIRDVNLGDNYIMNLSFYNDPTWLGKDLYPKYNTYLETVEEYTNQYTDLMSNWVATYNEYMDLVNAVPILSDIVRVGDIFTKLYCIYKPIYADEATPEQISEAITTAVDSLQKKLDLFHVQEDTEHNKSDNVLLTLENNNADSVTIRIYFNTDENTYKIHRAITNATTGLIVPQEYSLAQWIQEDLTAVYMNVEDYTIKSIGILGAYLVLAKDESIKENLEDYGIKLLQEKQNVYTKIFITQTEGYFSQEGYQCIASDNQPTGEIAVGTKWLDTDSNPLKLWIYQDGAWSEYNTADDMSNYENYARYIENYNKLKAVQEVLVGKEQYAKYLLDGVAITNRYLTSENINSINLLSVAQNYFIGHTLTLNEYSAMFGIIAFTVSSDANNEYAVYVADNGTPYIAYSRAQNVQLAKMNKLKQLAAMNQYFDEGELIRLSPFIREDEYSNSNFLLTGYESEEEEITIKQSLLEEASKELAKICQPKLSFSITMANILAMPEFESLKEQFKLGNFAKVEIRPGYIKRARLLEANINFADLSDFSLTFGDLITTKSEVDKTADLLKQAITAGKQVATSSQNWQKAVETSTKLDKAIQDGLKDAALRVGSSNGQSIEWSDKGILGRKKIEGTDLYENKQFLLTNGSLVFTSDNFATAHSVFGEYTLNGERREGILASAVVAGYVSGSEIEGGKINIGNGNFVVEEDGTVTMRNADIQDYVQSSDFADVTGRMMYTTEIISSNSTVFSSKNQSTTLNCIVKSWDDDITSTILASAFNWQRHSDNTALDSIWNINHQGMKSVTLTHKDVINNASFSCNVTLTD